MERTTRIRSLWVIGAAVAAYALMNVIIFYTTGSFGPVWFATSLLVYGSLLAATVFLAVVDTGEDEARTATHAPQSGARQANQATADI